jgi:hypothetical protein
MIRGRRVLLAAALAASAGAVTLSACSDDDGNDGLGQQAITVTVSPSDLTLAAGSAAPIEVTIARPVSFGGPVTVGAGGAPSGVNVAMNPDVIATGTTTAPGTLSVGPGVAPGTYPITISASGSNVGTGSATVTLVVTGASEAPAP